MAAFLHLGLACGFFVAGGELLIRTPLILVLGCFFFRAAQHLTQRESRVPFAQHPAKMQGERPALLPSDAPLAAWQLHNELLQLAARAERSGDPRWCYETALATKELLPKTVQLHLERGAADDDPHFLAALHFIRVTAQRDATSETQIQQAWNEHYAFLQAKATASELAI